jgi:hypothetical protein
VSKCQQLPVSMVMVKYYEHYGKHFKIGECGFNSLEDLLAVAPGVKVNIKTIYYYSDCLHYIVLWPMKNMMITSTS